MMLGLLLLLVGFCLWAGAPPPRRLGSGLLAKVEFGFSMIPHLIMGGIYLTVIVLVIKVLLTAP